MAVAHEKAGLCALPPLEEVFRGQLVSNVDELGKPLEPLMLGDTGDGDMAVALGGAVC